MQRHWLTLCCRQGLPWSRVPQWRGSVVALGASLFQAWRLDDLLSPTAPGRYLTWTASLSAVVSLRRGTVHVLTSFLLSMVRNTRLCRYCSILQITTCWQNLVGGGCCLNE